MSQSNEYGQAQPWPPQQPQQPQQSWADQPAPSAYPVQQQWSPAGAAPGYAPAGGMPPGAYKDATAAWLLWFFLGSFGAHHFYLGNTKRGVIYLVGFLLSLLTTIIIIGFLGLIALTVFWIIDAVQMNARLQAVNAQIYAANRAAGLA